MDSQHGGVLNLADNFSSSETPVVQIILSAAWRLSIFKTGPVTAESALVLAPHKSIPPSTAPKPSTGHLLAGLRNHLHPGSVGVPQWVR